MAFRMCIKGALLRTLLLVTIPASMLKGFVGLGRQGSGYGSRCRLPAGIEVSAITSSNLAATEPPSPYHKDPYNAFARRPQPATEPYMIQDIPKPSASHKLNRVTPKPPPKTLHLNQDH